MPERLGAFVAKAPGLPPSLRRAAIRAGVREALERAREIREGGDAAARDAWRLAALATASGDETQMARAGELLAAIGPLSFGHDDSVVRSGLPGAPFAEPSGGGGSALAAAAAPDAEDPAFAAAALRILSGLLCDSSSATVQLAASTTRLVLASRAARSAWDKHLSPLERAFLAPLAPADDADPEEAERDALRKSEAAASRDETHSPAPRLMDAGEYDAWVPVPPTGARSAASGGLGSRSSPDDAARYYDAWVRGVAAALLAECEWPLLRLARPVAARHAPLAELLLPAALADLAAHRPEGGDVHAKVSAGIARCLAADGGGCARVARATLAALDAMRAGAPPRRRDRARS